MPRRSMLLVLAGTIVGGCSRDAPFMAPNSELIAAAAEPATLAVAPADRGAADVDDALRRLVPTLGAAGGPVRAALLRLQANRNDQAAWTELQRALDAFASTVPDEHRPDFDALRLELNAGTQQ